MSNSCLVNSNLFFNRNFTKLGVESLDFTRKHPNTNENYGDLIHKNIDEKKAL